MSYMRVTQNDDKTYSITFDDKFYEVFSKYYDGDSYFNILYRLYGLLPQDFYHYIGAQFNAQFKPSPHLKTLIYTQFKNKKDAISFANDIDNRFNYIVANKMK